MLDVHIGGAKEFRDLARRANAVSLGPALLRGIEEGVKPAIAAAKQEPEQRLPRRGGLARQVAQTRIEPQVRTRGINPRVRIVAHPNAVKDPWSIDRGRLFKPTFGGPPWRPQLVRRGWFTEPMRESAPGVRARIERAVSGELRRM